MSKRRSLAGCLIVCAIAGLTSPQVRAADASATAAPLICTGLVPDDAFGAMVLYPQRVLANAALANRDIKSLIDEVAKHIGVSPLDFEQLVSVWGPPIFEAGSPRLGEPQFATFVRCSKPVGGAEMAAKLLDRGSVEEASVAGHSYYLRTTNSNPRPSSDEALCFLDEHTFVIASESWLSKVFDAKDAKSVLISALAANDPAADATIIFTNTDAAKTMIAGAVPAKSLAGPLKQIGDLPDLLQAAKLSIRTNPEISLKLTLLGKDDDSADKMAQMIKSFQQLGQAFLPALQVPPGHNMPASQREWREMMGGLAKKLIDGFVPHRTGKQVTVEIGSLGTLDTVVGKVVLPAIMADRGAAKIVQDINNLKQLGLAMWSSLRTHGRFPANAIYSKDGKPLLSWRVYVLPYLDQQEIFKQFHLDEPWDSANNKPLIAKMPAIFKSPGGKPLADGQTRYVVPTGKDTIFEGDKGIRLEEILDGAANTLLILEVGEDKAVTWTKPDDMAFDPQKPLAGLGTIGDGRMPVAFADGSVRMIHKSIDAETFRRLILRNDGQPIDPTKF